MPKSQSGGPGLGMAGLLEQLYTPMKRGLMEKETHREDKHKECNPDTSRNAYPVVY